MKTTLQARILTVILPILVGLGAWAYIVAKAATVQITHDESYTIMILSKVPVWDIVTYADSYTNNHILNTLLVKLSFATFGVHQLSARLPNILAFGVYFWFAFQFSRRFFNESWLSLMAFCVLIGNPYLLDFFALTRGYGLSCAFLMASTYHTAAYTLKNERKSLPLSMLFSVLAVYAQFATLHFYLGLNLALGLYHVLPLTKGRTVRFWFYGLGMQVLGALLLAALIYLPIKAILRDNQIAYYGKDGFWQDTIRSIVKNSLYDQGYLSQDTIPFFNTLSLAFFAIWGVAMVYVLYQNRPNASAQTTPSVSSVYIFSAALFGSTVLSCVLQFHLLGNQYAVDRTALFFYPLWALVMPTIPFVLGKMNRYAGVSLAILFAVFATNHIIRSRNFTAYREWWYDIHTLEALDLLKSEYEKTDKTAPIKVNTTWLYHPSFIFHREVGKMDFIAPFPFTPKPDTTQLYDYYYVMDYELNPLRSRYDVVKVWDNGLSYLLKKKPPTEQPKK